MTIVDGQTSLTVTSDLVLSDDSHSDLMGATVRLVNPVQTDSDSISVHIPVGSGITLVSLLCQIY